MHLQTRIGIGAYGHDQIRDIFTRQLVPHLSYHMEESQFRFNTYMHPVSENYSPFFEEAIYMSCNVTNNECSSYVSVAIKAFFYFFLENIPVFLLRSTL